MTNGGDDRPAEGEKAPRPLSTFEAIIPVAALILLVALAYFLFGDAGALGPNQVALTVATLIAVWIGWRARSFAGIARQGGDRKRRHRHRRHLHPVRRRRADRHLGDVGHAGGHGLLWAATAQPELLLCDGVRDHGAGGLQHRQQLDGRRHHRRRLHGHCDEHGAEPGHRGGRHHLGGLFRRQVIAAVGQRQSVGGGGRRAALHPYPRDGDHLVHRDCHLDGDLFPDGAAGRFRRHRQDRCDCRRRSG